MALEDAAGRRPRRRIFWASHPRWAGRRVRGRRWRGCAARNTNTKLFLPPGWTRFNPALGVFGFGGSVRVHMRSSSRSPVPATPLEQFAPPADRDCEAFSVAARGAGGAMIAGGGRGCAVAADVRRVRHFCERCRNNQEPAGRSSFRTRRGTVCDGEGAAMFVLRGVGNAASRGARCYAEDSRLASNQDAFHMAWSRCPSTWWAPACGRRCGGRSRFARGQIGYINATATNAAGGSRRRVAAVSGCSGAGGDDPLSGTKPFLSARAGRVGGHEWRVLFGVRTEPLRRR